MIRCFGKGDGCGVAQLELGREDDACGASSVSAASERSVCSFSPDVSITKALFFFSSIDRKAVKGLRCQHGEACYSCSTEDSAIPEV